SANERTPLRNMLMRFLPERTSGTTVIEVVLFVLIDRELSHHCFPDLACNGSDPSRKTAQEPDRVQAQDGSIPPCCAANGNEAIRSNRNGRSRDLDAVGAIDADRVSFQI